MPGLLLMGLCFVSTVRPNKYGGPSHRADVGLIRFCDALEGPPETPEFEQIEKLRDELFGQRQEFDRARAAFDQQAEAQALRLADFRKKLIACCGQMIDIADRCLASDNQELGDLQEVRERLENML